MLCMMLFLFLAGRHTGAQDLVWARSMGGVNAPFPNVGDSGHGIAVDGAGNVYTTGVFSGTADFDPGPGTYPLTAAGGDDVFISKVDSAGNFMWARAMGGSGDDSGHGIAVDAVGNVYATGAFSGTADFDPGPGFYYLTAAGSTDIFVSRMDTGGNFTWAQAMGGSSSDEARGIAVDVAGNIYTTGVFQGTADFDPGITTFNLTASGVGAAFVSKLDGAGTFLWARAMGGTVIAESLGIAVDSAANAHTTGFFLGTVDFDPGAGTFNLTSQPFSSDVFVSNLDSAGNFVWARAIGGLQEDRGAGIAVDGFGDVYTTGYFHGVVDFDPGAGTFNLGSQPSSSEVFVSKLDSSGNFVWARAMGGTFSDAGFGISVDGAGSTFTTGYFSGTADFDPGAGVFNLTIAGSVSTNVFISKLDGAGDFAWARAMGGTSQGLDRGLDIAVDGAGNVYATGTFGDTVDFDPGPVVLNLMSSGNRDIFVLELGPIASIPLVITQPQGPGTPVFIDNLSLVTGGEYYNIFSLEPCPNGSGTGPPFSLGICLGSPVNYQLIATQLTSPLGTEPYHFLAPATSVTWGPYNHPPSTVEAITFEFTGGVFGARSPVVRFVVQ